MKLTHYMGWIGMPIPKQYVIAMKIAFLLTVITYTISYGSAFSQRISVKGQHIPLTTALRKIEQQSGYRFIYDKSEIANITLPSIQIVDLSLQESMDELLRNQHISYQIFRENIVLKKIQVSSDNGRTIRQEHHVEGLVSDEQGQPLSGVSVILKNSTRGTSTDASGRFGMTVPDSFGTLAFNLIGYTPIEIPIENQHRVTITLKSDQTNLDEVVVVGLNNKQSRRSIVGAVATIQTKELKQSPVANLSNALAGRLPGLFTVQSSGQPGADGATMYIRGMSTYGPNKAPLIVIDGLPRSSGNFQQIDANEIESVTILKDASSTALYGIQGANGVIVVTTKRGSTGAPSINFTTQHALQQPVRLPQLMSAYQHANYQNTIAKNDGNSPIWSDQQLDGFLNRTDPYLYPDRNWFTTMLKNNASQQQHNINVSGGTPLARYFVSGSYIKQGTLLRYEEDNIFDVTSKFDRYNFRSNVDLTLTSMLDVQVDLAGRLEERVGPGAGFASVFSAINAIGVDATEMFNPNGTIASGGIKPLTSPNPYALVTRSGYYNEYTNVMYGTLSARHKLDFITPGLSIQGMFSFENNNFKGTYRRANYDSYWYKGVVDDSPVYQQQTTRSSLATSGSANITRYNYTDVRLNYINTWGQHSLTAQLLANRTLTVINDELPYVYEGLSNRYLYNFKGRYYVEFNAGLNGSENFPFGKRYGFFPAFSAGWIISDERFLKNSDYIDLLKLRGSFGLVGNDKIGGARWLYLFDYASGGNYHFGTNPQNGGGFNENRVGNPNVTWEKSEKANIGVDANLFNGKLQVTYDLFRELRRDILTEPGTIPDYAGVNNIAPRNTGKVINRGMEAELRYNQRFGEWDIFATTQVTFAKNKILEYDQPAPKFAYQDLRGYPIGASLGYHSLGLFNSQEEITQSAKQDFGVPIIPGDIRFADVNGDGVIDPFDRIPIVANNVAPLVFGLSFGASYKGIDVSVLFNGTNGGISYIGPGVGSIIYLQAWTPENKENAKAPIVYSNGNTWQPSNYWFQSSDYLKLRNAEVGYTLPRHWLTGVKLKYLRVFANGQNLAIWDKIIVKDRDPESTDGGNVKYPIQRIINFGINIQL